MPDGLQLDGEIVALRHDGHPDFHSLSSRMLHGEEDIADQLTSFSTCSAARAARRRTFPTRSGANCSRRSSSTARMAYDRDVDDGTALFQVIVDRGLEGVLAKRLTDPYTPGGRTWVKTKNRATARFAQERRRGQKIGSLLVSGPS